MDIGAETNERQAFAHGIRHGLLGCFFIGEEAVLVAADKDCLAEVDHLATLALVDIPELDAQDVDHFLANHCAILDQGCAILISLFQDIDAPADAAGSEGFSGFLRLVGRIDGRARETPATSKALDEVGVGYSDCIPQFHAHGASP